MSETPEETNPLGSGVFGSIPDTNLHIVSIQDGMAAGIGMMAAYLGYHLPEFKQFIRDMAAKMPPEVAARLPLEKTVDEVPEMLQAVTEWCEGVEIYSLLMAKVRRAKQAENN